MELHIFVQIRENLNIARDTTLYDVFNQRRLIKTTEYKYYKRSTVPPKLNNEML